MSEESKESSGLYLPMNHLEASTQAVPSDGTATVVYHDVSGPLPLASRTFESPAGTLLITDPYVEAKVDGTGLPLGDPVDARLTEADPMTRQIRFERCG